MKFNIIEKAYTAGVISAPAVTEWIDVSGCDSLVYVLAVSAVSTPGTANITLQASLDKTNVISGTPVNVTTTGNLALSEDRPKYRFYRVSYAIASGNYTAQLKVLAKGDVG